MQGRRMSQLQSFWALITRPRMHQPTISTFCNLRGPTLQQRIKFDYSNTIEQCRTVQPERNGGAPALGGGALKCVVGSHPPPREFGGREPRKNIFIMQNPAFWCSFGSENGQLQTGPDPQGTASGWGLRGVGPYTKKWLISRFSSEKCHKVHQLSTTDALCSSR